MAHPSEHGFGNYRVLILLLVLGGISLVAYVFGPPLYWHFKDNSRTQASCPSCPCDCPLDISIHLGLVNSSYADCGRHDPDMSKEMEKNTIVLLSEEVTLQKIVTKDNLEHSETVIMDAKRSTSHYQKEADKCNQGMKTCEGARQTAQAELIAECKLSALWQKRALELGWKGKGRVYSRIAH